MSFDVSLLSNYVDENREPLIGEAILTAKTAGLLTLQTGVKSEAALNLIEHTVEFGDGSTCGWDEAGETKLSQRKITVGHVKVNKSFCHKDLLKKWAGYGVRITAGQETLPFEQEFINGQIQAIGSAMEVALWQGDTDSLSENLNKFDGLIKIIDAASPESAVNTDITSITASNVMTVVDNVFNAIPAELLDKDNVKIFAGYDVFRTYIVALRSANLYHYVENMGTDLKLVVPGTNVELVGVNGLNGTNRLFAGQLSNMFMGTDLEGDMETFDFWYSKDNDEFRLKVEFLAGVQVAFPSEIVEFSLEVAST